MSKEKMKMGDSVSIKKTFVGIRSEEEIQIGIRKADVILHVNRIKGNQIRIDNSVKELKKLEELIVTEKEKLDYQEMTKNLHQL
ncbi:unnamed protein product [marine sediment metagenome]|uniref:Uncharacterized protein n=1 Tax=marine sediment metagenome TaxID=412755 RepID=X0UZP0_9ZZZZ